MTANMFLSVLLLILITLKLCGLITISWWWVAAPVWIPLSIALIFLLAAGVLAMVKRR